jgi:hypothetical protein
MHGRTFPVSKDNIHIYSSSPGIISQRSEAFDKRFVIQERFETYKTWEVVKFVTVAFVTVACIAMWAI